MHMYIRACVVLAGCFLSAGLVRAQVQEMTEDAALKRFERESPQARALKARVGEIRAEARRLSLAPNPTVGDRKSTCLNSSHIQKSRMPSSA